MKIRIAGIGALLAFVAFGATSLTAQECEDVSGEWAVTIQVPGQGGETTSQDVTVTFEQDGCSISGIIVGNNRNTFEDGTVEGSDFAFSMSLDPGDGSSMTFDWNGTVDGDSMSGTWGAQMVGSFDFAGSRADG